MTTTTPLSLLVGHAPLATEANLTRLTADELRAQLADAQRLFLPSGADVLGHLAHLIPNDMTLIETTTADGFPPYRPNPLVGITIIVEARDVAAHVLEPLQRLTAGNKQQRWISEWVRAGRSRKILVSRRAMGDALQGKWQPAEDSEPNPLLEAAALVPLLLTTEETAAMHSHILILRNEEPARPRPHPLRGWLQAQQRPFLTAAIFAIAFLAIAWVNDDLWMRDGSQVLRWTDPLFSFMLAVSGFLLPVWLVQGWMWRAAQRVQAKADFVPGHQVHLLEKGRTRPFVLQLSRLTLPMFALYQPPPQTAVRLPKPTLFCFLLVVFSFLGLLALLPFMPLPPWAGQFCAAFFTASLTFWLSQVAAG